MTAPDPNDEYRHTPDSDPLWNESYYLDWFDEGLDLGGYVRIGFYPNLDRVWYWACLVGRDRKLVTVIDHHVPLPTSDISLAVEHAGIRADHEIIDPLKHMRITLETSATEVDDPAVVYGDLSGRKVSLSFELDFVTDRMAYQWPEFTASPRYEIPCGVSGRITVDGDTIDFDGWGQRDHSWGAARDWWSNTWTWSAGRLDDGTRWHSVGGFKGLGDLGIGYIFGSDSPTGAAELTEVLEVPVTRTGDREGFFESSTHRPGALGLNFAPVAFSPVLLVDDAGRISHFPRALSRITTDDGRSGGGWIEWNLPVET